MKSFIIKIILFCSLLILVANLYPIFLISNDRYKHIVAGDEVYRSINKSEQMRNATTLIIGDSVGYQLFPNDIENATINSLASNQAIGVIGQFLLLNNYLGAGNHVDAVFLIYTPFSFKNNLDQLFTYHYFLKPFYTKKYKPLFSETVNNQISKIPLHDLCRLPIVLTSNWAPHWISKDRNDYSFLSPISAEYLLKIKKLSETHDFKFFLLSAPICFSKRRDIEMINRDEILQYNLGPEFEYFFDGILYLDDSNFADSVHLKKEHIKQYREYYRDIITRMR